MSWKTNAYLRQLRPMDGQQADGPETEPVVRTDTTPEAHDATASEPAVHPNQQPLFGRDDDHPVVAPFDPYSGCSCGCFDHFLCRCDKPYPSGDEEIPF